MYERKDFLSYIAEINDYTYMHLKVSINKVKNAFHKFTVPVIMVICSRHTKNKISLSSKPSCFK